MNTFMSWFTQLNWKSGIYHLLGIAMVFGTGQLTPELSKVFSPDVTVHIVTWSRIIGVILTIWTRSPAETPVGTITPQSNVK